jgi:hypothetical protein
LGQAGTEIFLQMGLDRANQLESFQEITVLLISRRGRVRAFSIVMAGHRPGHPRLSCLREAKTWMPGTRPRMTSFAKSAISLAAF